MKFKGLRTIVFDLDGTLCRYGISTSKAITATLERTGQPLDMLGDPDHAAARYLELWHEEEKKETQRPFRERIWARLLAENGIAKDGLARLLGDTYIKIRFPSLYLDPIVPRLLTELRRSFRLGLLTNGPGEMQWPKIKKLALEPYFDEIIVAGDVGIYKPNPRIFEIILERLGEAPPHALYVGDSYQMDVVGAKSAGLYSVWLKGADNPETLDTFHPDVEIEALSHLWEVL